MNTSLFVRSRTRSRARRGLTLIEIMTVAGLVGALAAPMFVTLMWVTRAYATALSVSRTRIAVDTTINQLEADIRNSQAGAYNSSNWKRLSGTAPGDPKMTLTLLDVATGVQIQWVYTRATGKLSRITKAMVNGTTTTQTTNYPRSYPDFQFAEISRLEYTSDGSSGIPRITGIRVTGRAFSTMQAKYTIWREFDGNGDGSFRNDAVGRDLFGLTYHRDDPKWQYIFNVQVAFRNT